MVSKANPVALMNAWRLRKGFEVISVELTKDGGRTRGKVLGVVTEMKDTSKGRVGTKVDQLLMLITTNTQKEGAPSYELRVAIGLLWTPCGPAEQVPQGSAQQPIVATDRAYVSIWCNHAHTFLPVVGCRQAQGCA